MLKNDLTVALRHLWQNRFFSAINIFGLGTGMVLSLLMLMYVLNEYGFEHFHKNRDCMFRVSLLKSDGNTTQSFASSMPALGPAIADAVPEVSAVTRILPDDGARFVLPDRRSVNEEGVFFADPEVFDVFSFGVVSGNPLSVLEEPRTVVLDRSTARKYFGNADPLVQTLMYYGEFPLRVAGIIEDVPLNTHFKPRVLISYRTYETMHKSLVNPWGFWGDDMTYVLVRDRSSAAAVGEKINAMMKQNTAEIPYFSEFSLQMVPISEIHWIHTIGDIGPKGNRTLTVVFLSAAVLVLLIACFNFMTLATAQYNDRIKEVGIRKVLGATRTQLVRQFLVESLLVTVVAMEFGVLLFLASYRLLYSYLEVHHFALASQVPVFVLVIMLFVLAVGVVSGSYPAWFLSRFHPAQSILSHARWNVRSVSFRQVSLIVQFSVSCLFLLTALTVLMQLDHMKRKDIGIRKNDVVIVPFERADNRGLYPLFRNELAKEQDIVSVCGAYSAPGINSRYGFGVRKNDDPASQSLQMQALPVDEDFIEAMGLQIVMGRNFSEKMGTDSFSSVMINESAAKVLGYDDPVGKFLTIPGRKAVTIIGVVRDFNVASLHKVISPAVLLIDPDFYFSTLIRINLSHEKEAIGRIKVVWERVFPSDPFVMKYMDEATTQSYKTEEKARNLLIIFTVLTMLVSGFGLTGLASYLISRKRKDIDVRKVLGASVSGIVFSQVKHFGVWVILANAIACPVAIVLLNKWLQQYPYRIALNAWMFVAVALATLSVAALVVGAQAFRAAWTNPVNSLRYE